MQKSVTEKAHAINSVFLKLWLYLKHSTLNHYFTTANNCGSSIPISQPSQSALTLYATFMKHTLITIIGIFVCLTLCIAQASEKPKRNALSFELEKNGLIYNVNYDHKLSAKNFGFWLGAGFNLVQYLNAIMVGSGGYYLAGKKSRFLELRVDLQYLVVDEVSDDQIAFAFVSPDYSIKTLYPSMNIGYRAYGKRHYSELDFHPV
jgi:hypothetical protein